MSWIVAQIYHGISIAALMHHVYLSKYPNITFSGVRRLGGFTLKVHHFFADHYAKSGLFAPGLSQRALWWGECSTLVGYAFSMRTPN